VTRPHVHAPIRSQRKERTLESTAIERIDRCRCGAVRVMVLGPSGFYNPKSTGWRPPEEERRG